jgi:hypothetical protein
MKTEAIIGLVLLTFLIVAPTVRIFFWKDSAGASVLAAVGAAALLLTRLPDISTFELLALKVTLEKQTQQVEVTIQQLQKMASAFAQASLTQLAMSGQMLSGINTEYKFQIRDRIVDSLKEIGVQDNKVLDAQTVWISVYGRMILDRLEDIAVGLLPNIPNEKVVGEIDGLPKDLTYGLPLPKDVRNWIAAKSLNDAKLTQFLDEYEYMWTTGAMKNPGLIPFNGLMSLRNRNP